MSFSEAEQKLVEFASGWFENLPHIKFALKDLAEKIGHELKEAEKLAQEAEEKALPVAEKAGEAAAEIALSNLGAVQE